MGKFLMKPGPATLALANLLLGAKSITLTCDSGTASVPISEDVTRVGVFPATGANARVGLEPPTAIGTKTGAAASSDLGTGIPVPAAVWSWFEIGQGEARTLYILAGAAEVVTVALV